MKLVVSSDDSSCTHCVQSTYLMECAVVDRNSRASTVPRPGHIANGKQVIRKQEIPLEIGGS